jgi:signal transduction histidine kinase
MTDDELRQLVASNAKAIEAAAGERSEMRQGISELRASVAELRASMTVLRTSVGDVRASIADLRDIVLDNAQRVRRLEGREIDLWGEHITLDEKVCQMDRKLDLILQHVIGKNGQADQ